MSLYKERRFRRSPDTMNALALYLKNASLRLGLDALVLSDSQGNLLAASHSDPQFHRAAAAAPEIFHRITLHVSHDDFGLDDHTFVEALPAQTQTFFLLVRGIGSPATLKQAGVFSSIRRILDV